MILLFRDSADFPVSLRKTFSKTIVSDKMPDPSLKDLQKELENVRSELQESERRYKVLTEAIPDGLALIDLQGHFIYVTPKVAELHGYDNTDELLSVDGMDLIHPEDREKAIGYFERIIDEEEIHDVRLRLLRKDGSSFPGEIRAALIRDEDGKATAMMGLTRDISERVAAEKELRESEEKFRHFFETSPMGIHIYELVDEDRLIFRDSNPAASKILGVDTSTFLGKTIEEAFPPLADSEIPERYKRAAREGIPWHIEQFDYEHDKIKGAYSVYAFQTSPNKMGVLFQDITERKIFEENLKNSEMRFRTLFEDSGSVMWIVDPDSGRIIEANEAAKDFYGYDDLGTGRRIQDINILPLDEIKKGLERVLKDETHLLEYRHRLANGEVRDMEVYTAPVTIKDKTRLYSILHDVTDRKNAEDERKLLEEQLYQSQKMESVGRLAGGIAHDFNNILTSVMGYAELLRMKFQDVNTPEGEAAEIIFKGAERAAELTQQLLGFARKGKFNPLPVNPNDSIVEAIKVTEKIFRKNITVKYELSEDISLIEADKTQLNQVWTNIIINARDAMPEGGTLTIHSANIVLDTTFSMYYPDIKSGKYVLVSITDTGIGMSDDIQKQIFEPFFSTKSEGKGTGLGLATVYGIVRNHDGYIKVYSETGKGTRFNIFFPATDQKQVQKLPEISLKRGKATILIVEDEDDVRAMAQKMLDKLGYRTLIASDGIEALKVFRNNSSSIELVLLDMIMPNMAGKETGLELSKINPDIRILLTSGYSKNGSASEVMTKNVVGFLQKPYTIRLLSEALSEALE